MAEFDQWMRERYPQANLRQASLDALHYDDGGAITLDPDAIDRERQGAPSLVVHPRQNWSPAAQPPPKPAAPPPEDTSFNPNRDLQLGFQSGAADLGRMLTKPAEDIYGGRLAGGEPLSHAVAQSVGPDPNELAARNSGFSRQLQFVGRAPMDAARYGLATVAAGGNPIVGAAAADALGANTPWEAAKSGLTSAAIGAGLHYLPHAPQLLEKGIGLLPDKETLDAARAAADARLHAQGIYGTATPMGQFLDPQNLRDLTVSTGAQLGSGMWTVGEAAAARARQVKDWLMNAREAGLTPQEQEKFAAAQQTSPELQQYGSMLTPLEARRVMASPGNVDAFSRLMQALPQEHQLAAASKMGMPKLGWYSGSAQAIHDIFGEDGPRFAQLLAAMSPQTSVESNLYNALNTWKNWTAAGRPADPAMIQKIMASSVQGGTEKSALHAWVPNSIAALSADDPMQVTLSGPKVDSFYHDLRNDVFKIAQDAWMANIYGIDQSYLGGQGKNLLAGNPGMTPEYAAANARMRAASLSTGMLPTQGQETGWSTGMQLYELAKKKGMDPRDVLQKGMLTPEIIAGAPDFSRLFQEPRYSNILHEAGYGQQLGAMQPSPAARIASTPEELANRTGAVLPPSGAPMSSAEQQSMMDIAGRLASTRDIRQQTSRAAQFPVKLPPGMDRPSRVSGTLQVEAYPGAATRHFPEMTQYHTPMVPMVSPEGDAVVGYEPKTLRQPLPWGSSQAYTSKMMAPLENVRGQSNFLTAAGAPTIPTENVIGAYAPEVGPAETNPARAQGFEAPLLWDAEGKPHIDPQAMANIRGAAAAQTVPLAQESIGIPALVSNPKYGKHFSIELPAGKEEGGPVTQQEIQAVQQKYPRLDLAHTGPRLQVLNNQGMRMNNAMRTDIMNMVRGRSFERADNVGDYLNFTKQWAKAPGSGAATRKMMGYVDQMAPDAQAGLDQQMRGTAGQLLDAYNMKVRTQKWTARPDLMNLLGTIRDQGLAGVRAGLKSGAFYPGLAGAFLWQHLRPETEQTDAAPSHE